METNKDDQAADALKEYFDNIKLAIESKFEEFDKKLLQKKDELYEIVNENLEEYSNLNNEVQEIQNKVNNSQDKGNNNFKEEVKNLKKMIDTFIDQCEELETAPERIKDLQVSDLVSVKNNEFVLKRLKLNYLKRGKKKLKGSGDELRWNKQQKKECFTLSEDDAVMKVNYSSCWNAFYGDKTTSSGASEVKFKLTISGVNSYCCIGIVNESYSDTSNCFCQKSSNAFMLYADGCISIDGSSNSSNLLFNSATEVEIDLKVNLDDKKITFVKDGTIESQQYNLKGTKFRFVVGMCTSGDVTYRILDSDISGTD